MQVGSSWKGMVRSSGGSMRMQWTTLILRLSVHSPVYPCWLFGFYHLHLIISTQFGFVTICLCWLHLTLDEVCNGVAMQTMRRKWNEWIQLKMEGFYFIDVNIRRLSLQTFNQAMSGENPMLYQRMSKWKSLKWLLLNSILMLLQSRILLRKLRQTGQAHNVDQVLRIFNQSTCTLYMVKFCSPFDCVYTHWFEPFWHEQDLVRRS